VTLYYAFMESLMLQSALQYLRIINPVNSIVCFWLHHTALYAEIDLAWLRATGWANSCSSCTAVVEKATLTFWGLHFLQRRRFALKMSVCWL